MANYTQQQASDFFFDFDNYFLWKSGQEIQKAYGQAFAADGIVGFYNQFRKKRKTGTFPQGLITYFSPRKSAIDFIANKQLEMLNNHFKNDYENERQAFIDFGEGVLFDKRRATNEYKSGTEFYVIHTMDAQYDPGGYIPPVGYHSWYGFIRVFALLNNLNSGRFLDIARNITLAWQIQSKLKPRGTSSDGSNPNNIPIAADELKNLNAKIIKMEFKDLDDLFDHKPYPESIVV